MIDIQQAITTLSYAFIPVLLGIILHEVAHGYVAYLKGDSTAKSLGRLTLNPISHIDPMGLLVFVGTALFSPFVFGWAKPIPVNTRNLRNPRHDMMWVAAAGPFTNFALAIVFAALIRIMLAFVTLQEIAASSTLMFILKMCEVGVIVNFGLGWINLIPIPPLDGSRLVMGILPYKLAVGYASIERFGFIILVGLLYFNVLSMFLGPLIRSSTINTLKLFGIIG